MMKPNGNAEMNSSPRGEFSACGCRHNMADPTETPRYPRLKIRLGQREQFLVKLFAIFFVSLVFAVLPSTSFAEEPSQHRQQLSTVLAYHRLQTVGSSLAYKTYSAYESEFERLGYNELKELATGFRDLAKCELDGVRDKRDAILALISETVRSAQAQYSEDAEKPWSIKFNSESPTTNPTEPSLVIKTPGAGDVEIEYQFFDASLFRNQARRRRDQMLDAVSNASGLDAKLIGLWACVLSQDWELATKTNESISTILKEQKPSEDQKQEWQYLLAVVAEGTGQSEAVTSFLNQRLTTTPTSLWAMRALSLLNDRAPETGAVLQSSAQKLSGGHHPFAREVLSMSTDQTERILDQYWTVAWAHTQVETQQHGWTLSETPNPPAAMARGLVGELTSPTVLESWKEPTLLRIATVLHSGVLVGDCESWQLMINEDIKNKHTVLNVAIRLSRDFSGLRRTGAKTDDDMKTLEEVQSGELIAMLWGNDASLTTSDATVASSSPVEDSQASLAGKAWVDKRLVIGGVVLGIIVAVIVFLKRQRVSAR